MKHSSGFKAILFTVLAFSQSAHANNKGEDLCLQTFIALEQTMKVASNACLGLTKFEAACTGVVFYSGNASPKNSRAACEGLTEEEAQCVAKLSLANTPERARSKCTGQN